jgi:hypothetical protein
LPTFRFLSRSLRASALLGLGCASDALTRSTEKRTVMPFQARPATTQDLAAIIELGVADAQTRHALDPQLWRIQPDASTRIESILRRELAQPDGPVGWWIVESGGRVLGVARFAVIPAPPVYDLHGGLAGVLLDETVFREEAPVGATTALLDAVAARMRARGVVVTVAACPAGDLRKRDALQARGFSCTTLYMVKHDLAARDVRVEHARRASAADIPGIVALNREAQERKREADPRFWTPHPDAPARFGAWMTHGLSLADRDLFVEGPPDALTGFIVAQPAGPLTMPVAHDASHLGLMDDFHATEFGASLAAASVPAAATQLLVAAEQALRARGRSSAMVICPAAWTAKSGLLAAQGYRTASLWMRQSSDAGTAQPASGA